MTEKHKYRFKQIQITDPEAPEVLTEEEIQRVLQTDDFEFKLFLSFLLLTGCRRNEALGIRWEDIDFTKRQMLIRGEIGKMGKRRTTPISKALAMVLISTPGEHSGLLFPNYRPNQVSMKFRRWIRQLGMRKGISLHSLRSTFACHLIQNGIDIYLVSRLLGHSSVKVTEKHYLTLNSDDASAAVESLTYVRVSANGSSIKHGEEVAVSS